MHIEFVARHVEIDDALREFAESKISKTAKFLESPIDVYLTLEAEKHRRIAELRITHRFGTHVAESETDDLRDAIQLVADKMEKQVRRSRKKFLDQRRKGGDEPDFQWPVDVLDAETVGDGRPKILKSSHLDVRVRTIEEAADALQASSNDFVVFRNAGTGNVNVLYKRRDSHYGLITQDA